MPLPRILRPAARLRRARGRRPGPARGSPAAGDRRRGRRRPHDDGPRAAPGSRPARAPGSRSPSTSRTPGPTVTGELRVGGGADSQDPVRHAGRARDRVAQDLPPVRAAARVRRQRQGPARRRRRRSSPRRRSPSPSTTSRSSSSASSSENPAKIVGELDLPANHARRARRRSRRSRRPTSRSASRPGPPSTGWSGRTSTRPTLTPGAARRACGRWIAGGGRLVIVGGTAGRRHR